MAGRPRPLDVFVNCPFDETYKPIFDAIVFALHFLDFNARCALELDDAGEVRLTKIARIIEECTYGIHDISSVGLDTATSLPRFNMPLELGLDLGCRLFGGARRQGKRCLILDREPYRYRAFISDISGQDIHAHRGDPALAIAEVRNWLAGTSRRGGLPGGEEIADRYARFIKSLPRICRRLKRHPAKLTFSDYLETVEIWLQSATRRGL